jgi:LytS/YehU family sensor histidine kinase
VLLGTVISGIGVETIHILIILPLFTQFSSAAEYIEVVHTTWLPMTASNAVGLILFLYILRE